jgi:hypothetical protein
MSEDSIVDIVAAIIMSGALSGLVSRINPAPSWASNHHC